MSTLRKDPSTALSLFHPAEPLPKEPISSLSKQHSREPQTQPVMEDTTLPEVHLAVLLSAQAGTLLPTHFLLSHLLPLQ